MYKLLFLILAFILNLSACKAQVDNNEIIDPIKPSPYKIIRDNPYIVLPDSLGGGKYSGFAFVEGQIVDSNLSVTQIRVMKLNLQTEDGQSYIDYYHGIDSTDNKVCIDRVKQYLPFFEEYLNSLTIEKIEGVDPKGGNIITLPIKFQ